MLNSKFTPKQRITKAKLDLNKERPFFSYVLLNMNVEKTEPTEQVPTMGVNQFGDLYWNEKFVGTLSDDELQGVLAHEVMHMATLTFQREGSRDKMLWNMATDIVINNMLLEENFSLPKGCLLTKGGVFELEDKDGKNQKMDVSHSTAEEVYDWLMKHIKVVKNNYGNGNGEGEGGYKGSFDSHLPGDENEKGESTGKGTKDSDLKANEEKWKSKAVEAATAAKARGNMCASLERMIEGIVEPKIDWRKRLYQFITKDIPVDYTMRRPGRRFYSTGCYFPSVVRENLEVIAAIDISGSISSEELSDFVGECVGIATSFQQVKMRCLYWGTQVHDEDDIEVNSSTATMLETYRPKGGGGTEMSCVARHVQKKGYNSRVFVILTDGYIESKPTLPNGQILFVLSKGGSDEIIKKYGEVCSLNDVERHMDACQ